MTRERSITTRRRLRRRGSSLLETLIAITVVTIGLVNALVSAVRCSKLQQSTAEYVQAHNTARGILEQLRSTDLTTQFLAFSAAPEFNVGDQQVEVRFPEEVLVAALGVKAPATARFVDLDGDGGVDLNPASADTAGLLPVRLTVQNGALELQLVSILTER